MGSFLALVVFLQGILLVLLGRDLRKLEARIGKLEENIDGS